MQYEVFSQTHSQKVGELVSWSMDMLSRTNEKFSSDVLLNMIRNHPEYDEVFAGCLVYPDREHVGISIKLAKDVFSGIKVLPRRKTA